MENIEWVTEVGTLNTTIGYIHPMFLILTDVGDIQIIPFQLTRMKITLFGFDPWELHC